MMPANNPSAANRPAARAQKRSWASGALLQNPVLVQAIGLTPVIVATTTVYEALWVSALSALHIFLCEALAATVLKKLPEWLRVGIYYAIGLGISCPATYLLDHSELPASAALLRLFVPLMALNSMAVARCERFAVRHTLGEGLRDAAANALGFTLVAVCAGVIREGLGMGSLFGRAISPLLRIRGFWMPFGGFLLLGAMAALLKAVLQRMASQGIYTGAEVRMDLAPEDRRERLEKSRRLLTEDGEEEPEEALSPHTKPEEGAPKAAAAPQAPPKAAAAPQVPQALSEEDKRRLQQTIDELLEDF